MSKKEFWNAPVPEVPGLSFCDRFTWERVLAGVKLSASARAVALTLCQYSTAMTGDDIYPGNTRLSAAAGAGARTVERALSLLRDSHLLIQTRRGTNMGGRGSSKLLSSVHRLCAPTRLVEMVADGLDVDQDGRGRALDFASLDPSELLVPCLCHPSNLADSNADVPVESGGELDDLAAKSHKAPASDDKAPAKSDDLPVTGGGLTTTSTTTSDHSSSPTKQLPASLTSAHEADERAPWEQQEHDPAGLGLGLMNEEELMEEVELEDKWHDLPNPDGEDRPGERHSPPPEAAEILRRLGYPEKQWDLQWSYVLEDAAHDRARATAAIGRLVPYECPF